MFHYYIWIFIIFLLCLGSPGLSSNNCSLPISQYQGLHDLYSSLNGPYWCLQNEIIQWNFSSPSINAPCTDGWVGIRCKCTNNTYNVAGLFLQSLCLFGTLPSSIQSLSYLQALNLPTNQIYGTIPDALTLLNRLRLLNLATNGFDGSIPYDIGKLSNLQIIELEENEFVGSIPESFYTISSLQIVMMGKNQFSGNLSENISQMKSLKYFVLSENYFSGTIPMGIYSCTNMEILRLDVNYFHGSISNNISNFVNLGLLILNENKLTGSIPTNLYQLTLLETIYLFENSLSGPIPPFIGNLTRVQAFSVDTNYLTGPIPVNIGSLGLNLLELYLYGNYLTGPIPKSINQFINIYYLSLSSNYLTGIIPNNVQPLQNLTVISIYDNYLSGSLPWSVVTLHSLTQIMLNENFLTGPIFEVYSNYSDLVNDQDTTMSEHRDNIVGISPSFGGKSPSFGEKSHQLHDLSIKTWPCDGEGLIFYGCHLSDEIQDEIIKEFHRINEKTRLRSSVIIPKRNSSSSSSSTSSNATESLSDSLPLLQTLTLTNNLFSGTLTANLFYLPSLETLSFGSNCFTGSIPETVCLLNQTAMDIDMSSMGGNFECPDNKYINSLRPPFVHGIISELGLSGTIPKCLMNFNRMNKLHLFGNNLHGTLPEIEMENSTLVHLNIANNGLTGPIPLSIQRHSFAVLDLSNNRLDGTLIPDFQISSFQTTLRLSVNRLSGQLPQTFINISSGKYTFINESHSDDSVSMIDDRTDLFDLTKGSNHAMGQYSETLQVIYLPSNLTTLDVLASNIFECNNQDLPKIDPYSNSYSCGSYELNIATFAWIILVISLAILMYFMFWIYIRCLYPQLSIHGYQFIYPKRISSYPSHLYTTYQAYLKGHSLKAIYWLGFHLYNILHRCKRWQAICLMTLTSSAHQKVESSNDPNTIDSKANSSSFLIENLSKVIRYYIPCYIPIYINPSWYESAANHIFQLKSKQPSKYIEIQSFLIVLHMIRLWIQFIIIYIICLCLPIYLFLSYTTSSSIVSYSYGYITSMAYLHGIYIVIFLSLTCILLLLSTATVIYILKPIFIEIYRRHYELYSTKKRLKIASKFTEKLNLKLGLDQTPSSQSPNRMTTSIYQLSNSLFSSSMDKDSSIDYLSNSTNDWTVSESHDIQSPQSSPSTSSKFHWTSLWYGIHQYCVLPIIFCGNYCLIRPVCRFFKVYKRRLLKYGLILFVNVLNITVTIAVNAYYVNSILNTSLSRLDILLLQTLTASFKVVWSMTYIPSSINILDKYTNNNISYAYNMQTRLFMMITNVIIAPCIATIVANQSCFYYIFNTSSTVVSYVTVNECGAFITCNNGKVCCTTEYDITYATDITPPFQYSYACGTALISAYVPVIWYSYIFYGLIVPVIRFVYIQYYELVYLQDYEDCKTHLHQKLSRKWTLKGSFLSFFRSIESSHRNSSNNNQDKSMGSFNESSHHVQTSSLRSYETDCNISCMDSASIHTTGKSFISSSSTHGNLYDRVSHQYKTVTKSLYQSYRELTRDKVKGRDIIVRLMLHAIVLLTFGIASPILGISISFGMLIDVYISQLVLGQSIEWDIRLQSPEYCVSHIYEEFTLPNNQKKGKKGSENETLEESTYNKSEIELRISKSVTNYTNDDQKDDQKDEDDEEKDETKDIESGSQDSSICNLDSMNHIDNLNISPSVSPNESNPLANDPIVSVYCQESNQISKGPARPKTLAIRSILSTKNKLPRVNETSAIHSSDSLYSPSYHDRSHPLQYHDSVYNPMNTSNQSHIEGSNHLSLPITDMTNAWNGVFVCFTSVVVTVTMFWSLLFFDMIADVFVNDGIAYAVVASLCTGFVVPFIILSWKNVTALSLNHSFAQLFAMKLKKLLFIDLLEECVPNNPADHEASSPRQS